MFSRNNRISVYVTYVERKCRGSCCEIWAQTEMSEYEKLMTLLENGQWEKATRVNVPPSVGDIVLAQYAEDGQWYRAIVLGQPESGGCRVQFTDFGNVEVVRLADIVQPSKELYNIPPLADRFLLDGVCASNGRNWTDAEVEFLNQSLINQEFLAEVVCEGTTCYPATIRLPVDLSSVTSRPCRRQPAPSSVIAKQGQLRIDQVFEAQITQATSKLNFWVQLLVMKPAIERLNEEINAEVSGMYQKGLQPDEIYPGLFCAAKYQTINVYTRAVICDISHCSRSCSVSFIDYGATVVVDVTELRSLPQKYLNFPSQVVNCGFSGPFAAALTLENFLRLLTTTRLIFKVKAILKSHRYVVEICQEAPVSAVPTAVAVPQMNAVERPPPGLVVNQIQEVVLPPQFPPLHFDTTQLQSVCISNVNDDGMFHCQLMGFAEQLNSLMMVLNHSPVFPLKKLHIEGLPCVVRNPYDRILYRAVVIKCQPDSDRLFVELVDFGTRVETTIYDVHSLTDAALMVPIQAISCSLLGAENIPPKILVSVLRRFESRLILVARVVEKRPGATYVLELFDTSSNQDVRLLDMAKEFAAHLAPSPSGLMKFGSSQTAYGIASADVVPPAQKHFNGLVSPSVMAAGALVTPGAQMTHGYQANVVELPSPAPANTSGTAQQPSPPMLDVPLKTSHQFRVTAVVDSNSFICQPSPAEHLQAMQDDLHVHYMTNNVPCLQPIAPGMYCCSQFLPNQRYCRAKIIRESRPHWVVEFIDLGIQELKDRTQIKVLLPRFASFPCYGIRCTLGDEYSQLGAEFLGDLLVNQVVLLYVIGQTEKGYVVRLGDCDFNRPILMKLHRGVPKQALDQNASREMIDGLRSLDDAARASKQFGFSQAIIPKSEWLDCEVSHVENPGDFFCQLSSTAAVLDLLMDEVEKHVKSLAPGLGTIRRVTLGIPVLAKYSEDGLWYRGRVTGLMKNSSCAEVFFVDYGNSEVIATTDVREIPAKILSVNEMALRCCLAGLTSENVAAWPTEEIEHFNEMVIGKKLKLCSMGDQDRDGRCIVHILDGQENLNRSFLRGLKKLSPGYTSPVIRDGKPELCPASSVVLKPAVISRQISAESDHRVSARDGYQRQRSIEDRKLDMKGGPLFHTAMKGILSEHIQNREAHDGHLKSERVHQPPKDTSKCFVYPSMRAGDAVECTVAYIFHPGKFFCQKSAAGEVLERLSGDLDAVYSGLENGDSAYHASSLIKGQACCAKFSEDGLWYRAKVLAVDSSSAVKVLFVDYGNEEVVPLAKIRLLQDRFLQIPVLSFQCSLMNVEPTSGDWSAEAINRFTDLALDGDLNVKIVDCDRTTNECKVELISQASGNSIHSLLIKTGFAKASAASERGDGVRAMPVSSATRKEATGNIGVLQTPRVGASANVFVSFTVSPESFWCQMADESPKLEGLMESLEANYNSLGAAEFSLSNPEVGQLCCARFSEDQQWYRASVISVEGAKTKIRYIDYGNEDLVSGKDLKKLKPEYYSLPPQAFECFLYGLSSGNQGSWSSEATAAFGELTDGKNCSITVKTIDGTRFGVELYGERKDLSIGTDLVNRNLAPRAKSSPPRDGRDTRKEFNRPDERRDRFGSSGDGKSDGWGAESRPKRTDDGWGAESRPRRTDDGRRPPPRDRPPQDRAPQDRGFGFARASTSDVDLQTVKSDFAYSQPTVKVGSKKKVIPCWFNSPAEFFCQLEENTSNIEKLQENLFRRYHTLSPRDLVSNLSPGKACAAVFEGDRNWYRGRVVSVEGPVASVLYVDYGNVEKKQVQKVKDLMSEFGDVPVQALRCALSGVENKPEGRWDVAAIRRCAGALSKPVFLRFKETKKDLHMVELLADDDRCLNSEILGFGDQVGSAKPVAALKYRTDMSWKPTESAEVEVVAVDDGHFFCQRVGKTDKLDELMARLAECYEKSAGYAKALQLKEGQPCAAKFSEDETWYRAVVESVPGDGQFLVRFVDFGNKELRPSTELRELNSEFVELPLQCYKCALARKLDDGTSLTDLILGQQFQALLKKVVGGILYVDLVAEDGSTVGSEELDVETVSGAPQNLEFSIPSGESTVCVANAINPSNFYVQFVDRDEELASMGEKLNAEYSALPPDSNCLSGFEVGRLCCAKFSEDSAWYRAVIKESNANDVDVLFVDYGNFDKVSKSDVKELSEAYQKIPAFSVQCCLENASPTHGWPEDQVAKFVDLTESGEKAFSCTFISQTQPCQVVLKDGEKNVNEIFQLSRDETSEEVAQAAPSNTADTMCVFVTHVNSSSDFYIQFSGRSEHLDRLSTELDEYVTSAPSLEAPAVGMKCASIYSADSAWYRAVIQEIHDDSSATVLFTDFGNADVADVTSLKALSESLSRTKPFAQRCCLAEIPSSPEYETSQATEIFTELTADKEMEVIVTGGDEKWTVKLIADGVDVLASLTEKLFGKSAAPDEGTQEPTGVESHQDVSCSSERSVPVETADVPRYSDPAVASGKLQVLVTNPATIEHVYIQLAKNSVELESLLDLLDETYAYLKPGELALTLPPVPGQACCVCHSKVWYRAVVEEVLGNDTLSVRFVDHGTLKTVNVEDVKQVIPKLLDIRPLAFKCQLVGFKTEHNGDHALYEKLLDFTSGNVLTAQISAVEGNQRALLFNKDICINSELFGASAEALLGNLEENEMNQKLDKISVSETKSNECQADDAALPQSTIREGSVIQVSVASATSPSDFWVSCPSSDTDLSPLMERIEEIYSSLPADQHSINEPEVGMLCVAKFSDDAWYRAKIIEVFENGTVKVFFIDYGNTYDVPLAEAKQLVPECAELPPQAVQAFLSTIQCCHENAEWDEAGASKFVDLMTYDSKPFDFRISEVVYGENGCLLELHGSVFDNGVDIAEQLVQEGHARFIERKEVNETTRDDDDALVGDKYVLYERVPCSGSLSEEKKASEATEDDASTLVSEGGPAVEEDVASDFLRPDGDKKTEELNDVAVEQETSVALAQCSIGEGSIVESNKHLADEAALLQSTISEGSIVQVHVASATSPSDFWVSCPSSDTDLPPLMERIEEIYSSLPADQHSINNPEVGMLCVAKFSDDAWYRAKIIEVFENGTVKVFFIDYGNTYDVPLAEAKELVPECAELPPQAVQAFLSTIQPCHEDAEWDEVSANKFVDLVTYELKPFDFKISEVVHSRNGHLLELHGSVFDSGVDIAEQLVKEGLARPVVSEGSPADEPNVVSCSDSNEVAQEASNIAVDQEVVPERQDEDAAEYSEPDKESGNDGRLTTDSKIVADVEVAGQQDECVDDETNDDGVCGQHPDEPVADSDLLDSSSVPTHGDTSSAEQQAATLAEDADDACGMKDEGIGGDDESVGKDGNFSETDGAEDSFLEVSLHRQDSLGDFAEASHEDVLDPLACPCEGMIRGELTEDTDVASIDNTEPESKVEAPFSAVEGEKLEEMQEEIRTEEPIVSTDVESGEIEHFEGQETDETNFEAGDAEEKSPISPDVDGPETDETNLEVGDADQKLLISADDKRHSIDLDTEDVDCDSGVGNRASVEDVMSPTTDDVSCLSHSSSGVECLVDDCPVNALSSDKCDDDVAAEPCK